MQLVDLQLPPQAAGRRLDVVLQELLGPEHSRAAVQRYIKDGLVTIDGQLARASQKAAAGQSARVEIPDPTPLDLEPQDLGLQVLYEDADLIVIDKPAGLCVHPAPGHEQATLVHGLLYHCDDLSGVGGVERPGIVHRLDLDTSGAMVAAKSDRAHRGLTAAFAAGHVRKTYLALVLGTPPATGRLDQPIGRHPVDRKRMSGTARNGKPALTRWRVTHRWCGRYSLLRVNIHTGRTHQIRVHLSEAGWPVAGDPVYGGQKSRRLPPGPVRDAALAAGRQLLHATELAFSHPVSGALVRCVSPLPADFRAVLAALAQEEAAGA